MPLPLCAWCRHAMNFDAKTAGYICHRCSESAKDQSSKSADAYDSFEILGQDADQRGMTELAIAYGFAQARMKTERLNDQARCWLEFQAAIKSHDQSKRSSRDE